MSPRWRKIIRDLSAHRVRTLLVVLSIAIGIYAVGVVLGTRSILLREFEVDFAGSNPPNATFRTLDFGDDLVRQAETWPGVENVEAVRTLSLPYEWEGREQDRLLSLQAFADFDDIQVGKVVPLGETPWPPGPGEVVLEAAALQMHEFEIGDTISVESTGGASIDLTVAGFAHDINAIPAQFVGFETGYADVETMADLSQADGYNQLAVTFEGDLTEAEAWRKADALRDELFDSADIPVLYTDVPEPGSHFLGDIFEAVSLLLLSLGVLALALSGFLVVNTVSAIMAQQVRQVGIMKAVGASAPQLERVYAALVAAYGVLGVALGVPAAEIGTRWFTDYAAEILNFRVTDYTSPPWVLVVEVAVGVLVPLLAAAAPVRKGVGMSVARALSAGGAMPTSFGHGLADKVLGAIRGLPRPVALSLRNTFLRKGRLALTLSTLALASAVVVSVFSVRASIERTVDDLEQWWRYDVQVSFDLPMPEDEVSAVVEQAPNVEEIGLWTALPASYVRGDGSQNESLSIVGLEPDTDLVGPIIVEGRWLRPGDDDAVVVNTDLVNSEPGTGVGSEIELEVGGERKTWQVVGVVKGQLGGSAVYVAEGALNELLGDPGITRLVVRGTQHDEASEKALLADIEERLRDADYPVGGTRIREALTEQVRRQLGILVAFLVIMAGILASVGVIGLTGSMTINVLESTREIGVMRATGAQHRSVFQIFVTEGMTVGAIAWLLGSLLSYPLSLALVQLLTTAIGVPLSFSFAWGGIGLWLLVMLAISALASLAPAFRASQVSVRDAIAYE